MAIINFYDADYIPEDELIYSVISSRYEGKWIFVRHKQRETFEMAAGHIEADETPLDCAARELFEETGAICFKLECICTYSVETENRKAYGRLFFAEVSEIGPVKDHSEIAEVIFLEVLPEMLTYPDIQPYLFNKTLNYIQSRLL